MKKNGPGDDLGPLDGRPVRSPAARRAMDAALRRYAIHAFQQARRDSDLLSGSPEVNTATARHPATGQSESGSWVEGGPEPARTLADNTASLPVDAVRLAAPADLGHRIRAARKRLGATQQELAELSGLSLGSIKALEAGGNVGIQHVFTVLAVVGVELYAD